MAELITSQKDERVAWLAYQPEESLDPGLQKLFRKAREALGFVPNVFVGYMVRPKHFSLWFSHFRELVMGEGELSRAEREMISVVVSAENHCLYCLVSHGADLRVALEDPILGDRIVFDYRRAGLDARTTAMLDYAVKITNNPVECEEADIENLRILGFSDEAIFDIAEIAAMYNFTNRLAAASGMLPNREYHSMGR